MRAAHRMIIGAALCMAIGLAGPLRFASVSSFFTRRPAASSCATGMAARGPSMCRRVACRARTRRSNWPSLSIVATYVPRVAAIAEAIPIMYDHPNYPTRIEVDTTTPLEAG